MGRLTTVKHKLLLFLLGLLLMQHQAVAQVVPTGFAVSAVNTELSADAVAFAILPDGRIVIANQNSGTLDLIVDGSIVADPLAQVQGINSLGNERGLLAVAIDPAWPDSNYWYTYQTMVDTMSRVLRFEVTGTLNDGSSSDLAVATGSPDTLLEMVDMVSIHNGGSLRFGSDRTLYVSLGDDNTRDNVQDLTFLHGKIARISPDPGQPLPTPNPAFPSAPPDALNEIFAFGFRNPFRFNIDPETDRLLIGDVGQGSFEEVDLSEGGENFGWPKYEGNSVFRPSAVLSPPEPTFPIFSYPHPSSGAQAVMGLLTYRQKDFPDDASFPDEYDGTHFVADFYSGPIWNLHPDGNGGWAADTFATGFTLPSDAAIASDGAVLLLEYGSALRRISYDPGPTVTLNATALLQGAYLGAGAMDTTLALNGVVPLVQPFADSIYDGSIFEFDPGTSVVSIPSGAVDWVLAELRTSSAADSVVGRQVGFLRFDGTLLDRTGSPGIAFPMVDSTSYYVVIRHRNHLSVMSSVPADFSTGIGSWDFSTSLTQSYPGAGDPIASLGDGRFGLFSGDSSGDGQITVDDFNAWLVQTKLGATGYLNVDFNLDGQVLVDDFNEWLANTKGGFQSAVPE